MMMITILSTMCLRYEKRVIIDDDNIKYVYIMKRVRVLLNFDIFSDNNNMLQMVPKG